MLFAPQLKWFATLLNTGEMLQSEAWLLSNKYTLFADSLASVSDQSLFS